MSPQNALAHPMRTVVGMVISDSGTCDRSVWRLPSKRLVCKQLKYLLPKRLLGCGPRLKLRATLRVQGATD
ncbi:hypothetical protein EMIT0P260_70044 [Pseudomonas sp. IT-P260]